MCSPGLDMYLCFFFVYPFLCTFAGFNDRRKNVLVVESVMSLTESKHRISDSLVLEH